MNFNCLNFFVTATIASHILLCGFGEKVPTSMMVTRKEELRKHLENLFSKERNDDESEEKQRVQDGLVTFLVNLKLKLPEDLSNRAEVGIHNYSDELLNGSNIVMTIKGDRYGSSEDEIALVGAHYDSTETSPGVDDNGSGMAALLEIARVMVDALALRSCSLLNSIIVVAFDHEEDGLVGSANYVKHMVNDILMKYDVKTFHGAYILETMMNFDTSNNSQKMPPGFQFLFPEMYKLLQQNNFRGDFMTTIVRQDDLPLAKILADQWYSLVRGDFETTSKYRQINMPLFLSGNPRDWPRTQWKLLGDFMRSDHYSFWSHKSNYTEDGLKAVFITDTANFRGVMAECYHNPCDDFSKVNDDKLEFLHIGAEAVFRSLFIHSTANEGFDCLFSAVAVPSVSFGLLLAMATVWKFVL